jgi:hypothetical protein
VTQYILSRFGSKRLLRVRDEPVDDGSPASGSTPPTRDYGASIGRQCVLSTYSVEKLISCALTILQINHSVAENQA